MDGESCSTLKRLPEGGTVAHNQLTWSYIEVPIHPPPNPLQAQKGN